MGTIVIINTPRLVGADATHSPRGDHSSASSVLADTGLMRATAPLFRLDPGWPYVLAGLALFAAGVLIPAADDLAAIRRQLDRLRHEETIAYARLKAYTDFLTALDDHDPVLVRRLAAAQLNLIPQGQQPVLQAASFNEPVKLWVESSIDAKPIADDEPKRQSPLAKWASGRDRLWLFAAAAMSVFVGLMLGPGAAAPAREDESLARAQRRSVRSRSISASTAVVDAPALPEPSELDDDAGEGEAFAREIVWPDQHEDSDETRGYP